VVVLYLFMTNGDPKSPEAYWLTNNGLCLWIPLMAILLILKQDPAHFGLQSGDRKLGMKWALILWAAMLLPLIVASSRPEFRDQYLSHRLSRDQPGVGEVYNTISKVVSIKALIYYELAMAFYMFCWEFFFRGFLLFGFQKTRLGTWGAVILQALPFMLLHWSLTPGAAKPTLEILGSFPAAIILGILAVRTRSMVYGFVAHWGVSASMDLVLLAPFIFRHIG
jgi:membrane protease YdiL (CAAX protease family)